MNRRCFVWLGLGSVLAAAALSSSVAAQSPAIIKVVYDNYVYDKACATDWGFACVITGLEKTILFDTGGKGELLLANLAKMKVRPDEVKLVVISHHHNDHMGGLLPFLKEHRDVSVFLPAKTPDEFVKSVQEAAVSAKVVTGRTTICKGAVVLGPMGDQIIEQALVLETEKGLVIVTGCAHPGIVAMAKKAKEEFQRDIYMILGGAHLLQHSEADLKSVIAGLKQLGVRKAALSHCTGNAAIAACKEAFGDDFIQVGAGRVVEIGGR